MRIITIDGEWNREGLLLLGVFEDGDYRFYRASEREEIERLIEVLEKDKECVIVGHNLRADLRVLMKYLGRPFYVAGALWDTMIWALIEAQKSGFNERDNNDGGFSLGYLVHKYLNEKLDKTLQESFLNVSSESEITEEMVEYNKRDVLNTYRLFLVQKERAVSYSNYIMSHFKHFKDFVFYAGIKVPVSVAIEFKFVNVLAISEFSGISVDTQGLKEYEDALRKENEKLAFEFRQKYRVEITQIEKLKRMLGISTLDKKEVHKELSKLPDSMKEKVIEVLGKREKITKAQKELGLIEDLISGKESNIRQIGAPTGRMSYSKPNLQQIPRDSKIREFINRECMKVDFATIELRLASEYVSRFLIQEGLKGRVEEKMKVALKEGKDLHTITAKRIYGKEEVSKEERQVGKAVNFASIYGISPQSLQEHVERATGQTLEGSMLLREFYKAFPEIEVWHRVQRESGIVLTLGGRLIKADSRNNALNYPVQGSGAEVLKLFATGVLAFSLSKGYKVVPVLYVHDEVHFRYDREEHVMECMEYAKSLVEKFLLKEVPFEYEVKERGKEGRGEKQLEVKL